MPPTIPRAAPAPSKPPRLLPRPLSRCLERPGPIAEFLNFGINQASASVFGALLLAGMVATRFGYPEGGLCGMARYDFLFLYAVTLQVLLLATRMETWREACVVVLYHVLATAMELFKTSPAIGSWSYPGEAVFRIGNVPLFAGFLYSAVGSYLARAWRLLDLRFERFPHPLAASAIALLAYANFFTHHYLPDLRWILIAAVALAYARTTVRYSPAGPGGPPRRMPLLLGFALVTGFLWIAENVGTLTATWIYPHQSETWSPVGWGKASSWFLLMQLSFVLVYLLRRAEARLGWGRVRSATKSAARPSSQG